MQHIALIRLAGTIAALMLITGPHAALADHEGDHFWINPAGGDFEIATNWDPKAVPDEEDTAVYDLDATYTVTFSGDRDNSHLRIFAGDVTLDIGEHMYRLLTSNSVIIGDGPGDNAILRLAGGTLRPMSNGRIGVNSGATGAVYVSGENTLWHHSGTHYIGSAGTGTLHISGGATYQHSATALTHQVGRSVGSEGHLIITGEGTTFTSGPLFIGGVHFGGGTGTLTIDEDAKATVYRLIVGHSANAVGTVTVSGASSLLHTTANVTDAVADLGTGTLIIENGGSVSNSSSSFRIGDRESGDGQVVVRDPDSTFATTSLIVGRQGTGSLIVEDGALATTTSIRALIGSLSTGMGSVTVTGAGSMWTVGGDGLFIGGTHNSPGGTGTLTIGPGAIVTVDSTFKIWEGEGNTLRFILAGPTACSGYGFLDVGGTIDLQGAKGSAGTLEIVLDDGYEPLDGHAFTLFFDFDSIEGEFDEIVLPELAAGLEWNLGDLYTTGVISVGDAALPCPGDINHDGVVDVLDLLILLDAWGGCVNCAACPADLNYDCIVDVLDLLILLDNWGACP